MRAKGRQQTISQLWSFTLVKFVFSKKGTKFDKIFTVDLKLTTYCQIDGEGFVNFFGLLRKHELYQNISEQNFDALWFL